jgi:riboflavin synthase
MVAVESILPSGQDMQLCLAAGVLDGGFSQGDSVAVNGVCLTALEPDAQGRFTADVSVETLECTTLGDLAAGDIVNVEPALRAGDPLGGHLVTGHVDGIGRVTSLSSSGRSTGICIEVPTELAQYVATKGSVCVDGVSLTVNDVNAARFSVNIIPHTAEATTFGGLEVGARVNIEVDLVARYLDRLLMQRAQMQELKEPTND